VGSIALAAVATIAAPPALGQAVDNVIHSERWPNVDVAVAETFTRLGSRTIDLGAAEAEIHVFVETDGSEVERLYWIQFEGYPPGSDNKYDYSSQPHADTIGEFVFLTGVRHGAYAASEVANEADTRTVSEILGDHGYQFPAPMMRARMVALDEDSRKRRA
jgi:hypothetical protein